jgi:alkylation response protein AidB-like acyl-CoA dehydrogenase
VSGQDTVEKVRDFVEGVVQAQADSLDESHTYPAELIQKLAQLGVFGLPIPRQYGGADAPVSVLVAISRQLARGWLSLNSVVGTHWRVVSYILNFGTEAQKESLLPSMASGVIIAANGHTERNGKDWRFLESELVDANGAHTLSGTKTHVTNAAHASLIAITARCSDQTLTPDGYVLVILPRTHPGLTVGPDQPRFGIRGVQLNAVTLDRANVDPARHLLGKSVGARTINDSAIVPKMLDISARAIGLAERLVELSLDRLAEDRSPRVSLSELSLARHRCAVLAGKVRMAALALERLASMADGDSMEATDTHYLQVVSTDLAVEVANETMLLHGGDGYTSCATLQRNLRDVTSLRIVGTPRDQVLDNYTRLLLASHQEGRR